MVTYTMLADMKDGDIRNVQEWARSWGEIQNEIDRFDGDIIEAYAVLGDYDFQFTYDAPDEEAAIQIAVALERYGLDTTTHQLVDIERLGSLTEDI